MDQIDDVFGEPTSSGGTCSSESHDWSDGWGTVCAYQVPAEMSYGDSAASCFTDSTYWRADD